MQSSYEAGQAATNTTPLANTRATPRWLTSAGLLHQVMDDRHAERVDVLEVGAEAHPLLAQPDRVLAGRDAVERLQL